MCGVYVSGRVQISTEPPRNAADYRNFDVTPTFTLGRTGSALQAQSGSQ